MKKKTALNKIMSKALCNQFSAEGLTEHLQNVTMHDVADSGIHCNLFESTFKLNPQIHKLLCAQNDL